MSVPVVVTVHGNQQCEAEATVFWDNAFAEKVRGFFRIFWNENSLYFIFVIVILSEVYMSSILWVQINAL